MFTGAAVGTHKKEISALFISGSEDLHMLSNDLAFSTAVPSPQLSTHAKLKHFGSSLVAA